MVAGKAQEVRGSRSGLASHGIVVAREPLAASSRWPAEAFSRAEAARAWQVLASAVKEARVGGLLDQAVAEVIGRLPGVVGSCLSVAPAQHSWEMVGTEAAIQAGWTLQRVPRPNSGPVPPEPPTMASWEPRLRRSTRAVYEALQRLWAAPP